jgi:ketosteroid isomerase-like protein
MSQKNVEILRAFYEALNRGDWEAASRQLSPEIEWETDPRHPEAGIYRGHEGFRRFLEDIEAPFEQTITEIEECFTRDDKVAAFVKIRRRPEGGSADVEIRIGELWTVRDGKLVRGQGFGEREKALEALGPAE